MIRTTMFRSLICSALLLLAYVPQAISADYKHSIKEGNIDFSWSVAGEEIAVKLSAPTEGWVAVGFNATKKMKDADIIIGGINKKGELYITDEFGNSATGHKKDTKLGGVENVTKIGGSEENGVTTIEFTVPLKSGDDKTDTVIDPNADTTVILAYGERDSLRAKHGRGAAHTITVNLGSGAKK